MGSLGRYDKMSHLKLFLYVTLDETAIKNQNPNKVGGHVRKPQPQGVWRAGTQTLLKYTPIRIIVWGRGVCLVKSENNTFEIGKFLRTLLRWESFGFPLGGIGRTKLGKWSLGGGGRRNPVFAIILRQSLLFARTSFFWLFPRFIFREFGKGVREIRHPLHLALLVNQREGVGGGKARPVFRLHSWK